MRKISGLLPIISLLAAWLSPAAAYTGRAALWDPVQAGHLMIDAADAPDISLAHVWARPTIGAAASSAVYFTVTNTGAEDQLVGVSTPVAAASVHETINDNGIMKMRPVADIALDPGKPVMFKPGGYHVMLTGLKAALKPGDSFPLTLTFRHAQPITVTAKVEAGGGAVMNMGNGGMKGN